MRKNIGEEYQVGKNIKKRRISSWEKIKLGRISGEEEYQDGKNINVDRKLYLVHLV